jgi:uncharacterized protein (TIGR02996 family)
MAAQGAPVNDEVFLTAIEAESEERTSRLVYADWLDERGDPHASLIRTEEAMRTVPIYADRYWELKRCRQGQRAGCDPKWLRRMRYGVDYEPVFREVPDDWRGRWRLIREFVERWYGVPLADAGTRRREGGRLEKRLGRAVPPALHEWVAFHADVKASWDRVFRDDYALRHLDDAVTLMLQDEGDVYWAVRHQHLDADDPPVEAYHLVVPQRSRIRFDYRDRSADSLTAFVFHHINFRLTQGVSNGYLNVCLGSQGEVLELVKTAFPIGSQFGEKHFFEASNLLAWVDRHVLLVKAPRLLDREDLPVCLQEHVPEGRRVREMVVRWPREEKAVGPS